jgi:hypothetical protein
MRSSGQVVVSGRELSRGVPPRPFLRPQEWGYWLFFVMPGHKPSIGWQYRAEAKGGPCYLVGRETVMGDRKILKRFPFTDYGWEQAWRFLAGSDAVQAERLRAELDQREAEDRVAVQLADLDSRAMASVLAVKLLGGYAPGVELTEDEYYDIRFLAEQLTVMSAGTAEILLDLPYGDVEDVDIGGPGEVSRWSRAQQAELALGFGWIGALMAYSDTTIKTIIRLRAAGGELYFLCDTVAPDDLRVRLSRPLFAIRAATSRPASSSSPRAAVVVNELSRLASLLRDGLLSQEEYELLKAQLVAGS